jgi:hypothetical protein
MPNHRGARRLVAMRAPWAAELLAVVVVPSMMTACERSGRPSPAPRSSAESAVTAVRSSATTPAASTPGPPPRQRATRDFRCAALPGVSFQFPAFPQWEPKRTVERPDGCIVYLEWPIQIAFETARLFQVSRIDGYDAKTVLAHAPGAEFSLGTVECFDTRRNPHDRALFASTNDDARAAKQDAVPRRPGAAPASV